MQNLYITSPRGAQWYKLYTDYLNNYRYMKHEEIISELSSKLKQLQQEIDLLKKESLIIFETK